MTPRFGEISAKPQEAVEVEDVEDVVARFMAGLAESDRAAEEEDLALTM